MSRGHGTACYHGSWQWKCPRSAPPLGQASGGQPAASHVPCRWWRPGGQCLAAVGQRALDPGVLLEQDAEERDSEGGRQESSHAGAAGVAIAGPALPAQLLECDGRFGRRRLLRQPNPGLREKGRVGLNARRAAGGLGPQGLQGLGWLCRLSHSRPPPP